MAYCCGFGRATIKGAAIGNNYIAAVLNRNNISETAAILLFYIIIIQHIAAVSRENRNNMLHLIIKNTDIAAIFS